MIARTSLGDLSRALVEELAAAGLDPRAVHAHVADAFEEDLPGGADDVTSAAMPPIIMVITSPCTSRITAPSANSPGPS